jgi:hypothetical protein
VVNTRRTFFDIASSNNPDSANSSPGWRLRIRWIVLLVAGCGLSVESSSVAFVFSSNVLLISMSGRTREAI